MGYNWSQETRVVSPTQNLEEAIHPFGFYLVGVNSVDRGWVFELHDHYNSEQYWNFFIPDFTDKNVAGVISQIGVLQ